MPDTRMERQRLRAQQECRRRILWVVAAALGAVAILGFSFARVRDLLRRQDAAAAATASIEEEKMKSAEPPATVKAEKETDDDKTAVSTGPKAGEKEDSHQKPEDDIQAKTVLEKTNKALMKKLVPATPPPPAEGTAYTNEAAGMLFRASPLALDDAKVKEALTCLQEYFSKAAWEERLPCVFNSGRVSPHMREYYDKRGARDPDPGKLMQASLLTIGTSEIIALAYDSATRPKIGTRAFFHRAKAGSLLLDWDAWAAYSETSWPEIKISRPQVPVLVRAVAMSSDYYNHEFGDSMRHLAIKLYSPDGLHYFNAYVPRDSALAMAMANLVGVVLPQKLPPDAPYSTLRRPNSRTPVTVRVAYKAGTQSADNVLITHLIADRWFVLPAEE